MHTGINSRKKKRPAFICDYGLPDWTDEEICAIEARDVHGKGCRCRYCADRLVEVTDDIRHRRERREEAARCAEMDRRLEARRLRRIYADARDRAIEAKHQAEQRKIGFDPWSCGKPVSIPVGIFGDINFDTQYALQRGNGEFLGILSGGELLDYLQRTGQVCTVVRSADPLRELPITVPVGWDGGL